jgi:DNA-binding NtrC family response regulator
MNSFDPAPAPTAARPLPTAIVFEQRPRWAPELERQFADEGVRVIACRSLTDVAERSARTPVGVILLDLQDAAADCLRFLGRRVSDAVALPVLIVGSDQTADLEWPVRDLGALAFFATKIPGDEMASLCRRQWSNNA